MYITGIEPGRGKRYRVYGDEEYLFSLYGKELKQYHIQAEQNVEDRVIQSLLDGVIYRRARERACYLLERKPFSTYMMKMKLVENEYPIAVVDRVIAFLQQYHYLDDEAYVQMYVETYSGKKSRRQIQYALLQQGIDKNLLETFFANSTYSEEDCFNRQFQRYVRGKDLSDWKIRQKVYRYFYGKGFGVSLIETALAEHRNG